MNSCPPWEVRSPEWAVALVLRNRKKHSYETLKKHWIETSLLRHFLMALASAERVGELHGLSSLVHHLEVGARSPFPLSQTSLPRPRILLYLMIEATDSWCLLWNFVDDDPGEMTLPSQGHSALFEEDSAI